MDQVSTRRLGREGHVGLRTLASSISSSPGIWSASAMTTSSRYSCLPLSDRWSVLSSIACAGGADAEEALESDEDGGEDRLVGTSARTGVLEGSGSARARQLARSPNSFSPQHLALESWSGFSQEWAAVMARQPQEGACVGLLERVPPRPTEITIGPTGTDDSNDDRARAAGKALRAPRLPNFWRASAKRGKR